ncbi:HAD family hydrolase [Sulfurospirillum sp. 1612]|uniref:HAD family hydrolase n=1 Tax=Sulfurospirillum sp. 1612 TaxID=3094835 RepID=UPI002F92C865
MIKSVIFDMDGTLLDSSFAMTQTVNQIRDTLGLKPISQEFLEFHINQPDIDLPMTFYGLKEYTPEYRALFKDIYMQNSTRYVKPYEGVFELLHYLKDHDIFMSIATNASDFFANHMLEDCHMLDFFDLVIGANNVPNKKPEPDMVHLILDQSNTHKDASILIGDSIKDEWAAKHSNVPFIFADWGYGTSNTATMKIETISKLSDYFKEVL